MKVIHSKHTPLVVFPHIKGDNMDSRELQARFELLDKKLEEIKNILLGEYEDEEEPIKRKEKTE